nr:MAG TPA: hypothetical protein [Caudoviricetes sp.]
MRGEKMEKPNWDYIIPVIVAITVSVVMRLLTGK